VVKGLFISIRANETIKRGIIEKPESKHKRMAVAQKGAGTVNTISQKTYPHVA